MGANAGNGASGYLKGLAQSMTLGLVKYDDKGIARGGWEGSGDAGDNMFSSFKQGLLGAATASTSSIKTGGGQYGDETIADSLFPKTVNNAMLDGREQGRAATDYAQKKALGTAPVAPDATDQALSSTRRNAAARLMTGQGRANSFIGGL